MGRASFEELRCRRGAGSGHLSTEEFAEGVRKPTGHTSLPIRSSWRLDPTRCCRSVSITNAAEYGPPPGVVRALAKSLGKGSVPVRR